MFFVRRSRQRALPLVLLSLFLLFGLPLCGLAWPLGHKNARPTARVRVEVTAGTGNQPVAEASVYLKFDQDPNARKTKQIEINLKTSQEGVAESPAVPQGQMLIQIIAPGWKTYGEWYDINQPEQTVRIHLTPNDAKWY